LRDRHRVIRYLVIAAALGIAGLEIDGLVTGLVVPQPFAVAALALVLLGVFWLIKPSPKAGIVPPA
jgi:hypothetical protein